MDEDIRRSLLALRGVLEALAVRVEVVEREVVALHVRLDAQAAATLGPMEEVLALLRTVRVERVERIEEGSNGDDLVQRVEALENALRQRADREGYASQGSRYAGKHPRTCACDRCLEGRFGG